MPTNYQKSDLFPSKIQNPRIQNALETSVYSETTKFNESTVHNYYLMWSYCVFTHAQILTLLMAVKIT